MPIVQRPRRQSIDTLIDREVCALDALLRDLRLGIRHQGQFDELEARADGIAQRIRAAFRGELDRGA